MSEEHNEGSPDRSDGPADDREPAPSGPARQSITAERTPPSPPVRTSARVTLALALALAVAIAAVVLSPFWAPAVAPLVPWGGKPAPTAADYAALGARLGALEQRPPAPTVDAGAIKSAQDALSTRIEQLEAARNAERQGQAAAAAATAALQRLAQRVDGIETRETTQTASATAGSEKMQRELARLDKVTADFGSQLPALERQLRAQSNTDRNGAVLLLALLQMREAVAAARPFPAEYGVFQGLVRDEPDLAAAAAPLAGAARDGVASRTALQRGLAELAGKIAAATPPAAQSSWWMQALDRLRRLVTIRRIDGTGQTGPEAAVRVAQSALARGELSAAVAALDPLTGANAEAARPWLAMARKRLAVEAALTHVQELLAARLGGVPPAAPAAAPAQSPTQSPTTGRAPS